MMAIHIVLTINMFMFCAAAPITVPINPSIEEQMKNHRRPKISEMRPTRVNPTAKPAVHEIDTQMMLGDGPIAALMRARVLDGNTHPRYPEI